MTKHFQTLIIIFAVAAVALGDVAIKKATQNVHTIWDVITNKWFLSAIALYMAQIIIFAWMFVRGWDLSIIGSLQTLFYALIVLSFGYFMFGEKLSTNQLIGIVFSFISIYFLIYAK